jgi:hypothetical protein
MMVICTGYRLGLASLRRRSCWDQRQDGNHEPARSPALLGGAAATPPFGRAAQARRITQPALSKASRALASPFKVTIARLSRHDEVLARELAVWPE